MEKIKNNPRNASHRSFHTDAPYEDLKTKPLTNEFTATNIQIVSSHITVNNTARGARIFPKSATHRGPK
jgi:hypothetical protein